MRLDTGESLAPSRLRLSRRSLPVTWLAALAVGLALAGCTGSNQGTPNRATPSTLPPGTAAPSAPGAGSLLAFPGRLVDRPVASSGCGRRPAVRPGATHVLSVAVPPARAAGARRRVYWLHVPAGYSPGRPAPLVLAFHGGGGSGTGMERSSGLSRLADSDGFLVAYPQGLVQDHGHGVRGWDASGPADPYANGIDDGLYVSDLLNAVQAGYCVDPARIAATGMSNGGSMAGYLACVLSGRIAAFAPVEGVFFQIPGGCHPAHPAAVLDVHVRTDPVAPYAGVPSRGSPDYYALAVPVWVGDWALRDGCASGPVPAVRSPVVFAEQWTGCPAGAGVMSYVYASGGHTWFKTAGSSAGDRLLERFFAAHPLRPAPVTWAPHPVAPVPAVTVKRALVASVREFRLPTAHAEPFDIAAGPDGSMWFTEFAADKIGRISPSGVITQYQVPTAGAGPYEITAGPGGWMWFTEYNTTRIGRVSPAGHVGEIKTQAPSYGGLGITAGPAGRVYSPDAAGFIDQITASGAITRTRLPAGSAIPFAIARRGGQIWFSELTGYFEYSRRLVRLPGRPGRAWSGVTLRDRLSNIVAVAAGPSGALWFADFGTSTIGELTPAGRLRTFGDGSPNGGLSDLAIGPDGAIWFSQQDGLVGRLAADGTVSELAMPSPESNPDGIAAGPGRTIWVTETGADSIVKITLRNGNQPNIH